MRQILLFSSIIISSLAAAQDTQSLVQAATNEFQGKILMLRGFPTSSYLEFNSDFRPAKKMEVGSWTISNIEVQKVELVNGNLLFSGTRVGYARGESGSFGKVKTPMRMKLMFKAPPLDSPAQFVEKLREAVFITATNELSKLAPPAWTPFLKGDVIKGSKDNKATYVLKEFDLPGDYYKDSAPVILGQLPGGEPIYRAMKRMSPPKPIESPDPEPTELSNILKLRGISLISTVVHSNGQVSHVTILNPLGLGLDDQAVAAVQKWKFRPATLNGVPVSVLVNIEVGFNTF